MRSPEDQLLIYPPRQLFESLRKQVDPKELEEQQKELAEKQAAQSAKAQERLAHLVCK